MPKISDDEMKVVRYYEFVENLACVDCCFEADSSCDIYPCGGYGQTRKDGTKGGFREVLK